MLPSARIQAAIDLLDEVGRSLEKDGASADVLIRKYFRKRRYAGSKDRRSVTAQVYTVIRNWGYLQDRAAGDVRKMTLISLMAEMDLAAVQDLCNGKEHSPAPLSEEEKTLLMQEGSTERHHRLNYPKWLEGRLESRFGQDFDAELSALNGRAPFDLRVNVKKTNLDDVSAFLKAQDINFSKGQWADTALVLPDHQRIDDWDIYKNGDVEVQDEAAQLAIQISDFKPTQQVMDLCAGSGGKTLAAAAHMDNQGQIYAFDISHQRLKDLKPRAKKADVHIIQVHELDTAGGKRDKYLAQFKDKMDRVMLDVPCSGSGVWRRNPESKWRLDEDKLAQYCRIQKNLLREGWNFVSAGGQMIYMTCSLFEDENEQQIRDFLATVEDAKLVSCPTRLGTEKSEKFINRSSLPDCLALSPHTHGTDGFFVAIMEKKAPREA